MRLDNYTVEILGGSERPNGLVAMQHGQVYRLRLINNNTTRCNAVVKIDGKEVGTWRLNAWQNATLEHPADDQGQFTFYRKDSAQGYASELNEVSTNDLGLIEVEFIPEKKPEYTVKPLDTWYGGNNLRRSLGGGSGASYGTRGGNLESFSMGFDEEMPTAKGMNAGGTGLSGESSQHYGQASSMPLDYENAAKIYLRLFEEVPVSIPAPVRPLRPAKSTRIPAPVGR